MRLRDQWRTVKAEMDALAKTHKAAIESKDLQYVRSSKAFELGFGPLLDTFEKAAEKAEKAGSNASTAQKTALKAAGLRVISAGAAYLKLLNEARSEAERARLPADIVHGIGHMRSAVSAIRTSVNLTVQQCCA